MENNSGLWRVSVRSKNWDPGSRWTLWNTICVSKFEFDAHAAEIQTFCGYTMNTPLPPELIDGSNMATIVFKSGYRTRDWNSPNERPWNGFHIKWESVSTNTVSESRDQFDQLESRDQFDQLEPKDQLVEKKMRKMSTSAVITKRRKHVKPILIKP